MLFNRKPKKSLREMAAEFIFQNSPDAYFVLDGGAICECNAALEEFMGQPRDKLIGVTPDRLSPERQPDGRLSSETAMGYINAAMSKGCARFEWMHQRLDGSRHRTAHRQQDHPSQRQLYRPGTLAVCAH